MLRHISLFAWLFAAAACLVAAAEPETPTSSNWVPAGQARESVYRLSEGEPALIPVAQNGSSNLADRLKAIRNTGTPEASNSASSRRSAPPATVPDEADGAKIPSVLVRRGSSPPSEAAPTDEVAEDTTAPNNTSDAGTDANLEERSADAPPRTARRVRRETETSGSPATLPTTPNAPHGSPQLSLSSQGPMLTVETEGPRAIVMGKAANYRIRLVNQGSAEADRVIVTVAVPAWVQIGSTQARVGSVNGNNEDGTSRQILWELEHVAARSQQELAISLQPTENRPIDLVVDWVFARPRCRRTSKSSNPNWRWRSKGRRKCGLGKRLGSRSNSAIPATDRRKTSP